MTWKSSRLYQDSKNNHLKYEGGIELNPIFRKNINKLDKISPKFIILFILLNTLLSVFWFLFVRNGLAPKAFEFILGAFILSQFFVHTRHYQNYFLFKATIESKWLEGKIEYKRPLMHELAGVNALTFSIIYLLLYLLTFKVFFLGGAVNCLALFNSQRKWLKKYNSSIT